MCPWATLSSFLCEFSVEKEELSRNQSEPWCFILGSGPKQFLHLHSKTAFMPWPDVNEKLKLVSSSRFTLSGVLNCTRYCGSLVTLIVCLHPSAAAACLLPSPPLSVCFISSPPCSQNDSEKEAWDGPAASSVTKATRLTETQVQIPAGPPDHMNRRAVWPSLIGINLHICKPGALKILKKKSSWKEKKDPE